MATDAQYEAVETELQQQLDRPCGADPATVDAERIRLRAMAERVEDAAWRRRAIARAEHLPQLLAGPPPGTSAPYLEAQRLYAEAVMSSASRNYRILALQRTMERIAGLAAQAPPAESGAVLLLNSTLVEQLRLLSQEVRRNPGRGVE